MEWRGTLETRRDAPSPIAVLESEKTTILVFGKRLRRQTARHGGEYYKQCKIFPHVTMFLSSIILQKYVFFS
jgi:hypothetical protein